MKKSVGNYTKLFHHNSLEKARISYYAKYSECRSIYSHFGTWQKRYSAISTEWRNYQRSGTTEECKASCLGSTGVNKRHSIKSFVAKWSSGRTTQHQRSWLIPNNRLGTARKHRNRTIPYRSIWIKEIGSWELSRSGRYIALSKLIKSDKIIHIRRGLHLQWLTYHSSKRDKTYEHESWQNHYQK